MTLSPSEKAEIRFVLKDLEAIRAGFLTAKQAQALDEAEQMLRAMVERLRWPPSTRCPGRPRG